MSEVADQKLNEIIRWLKTELQPTKLILYGSRVTGTARPDSDYDFVAVVSQFQGSRIDRQFEIFNKARVALGVDVQVWIYDQDEFDFRKDDFSSIPETAVSTGRKIEL